MNPSEKTHKNGRDHRPFYYAKALFLRIILLILRTGLVLLLFAFFAVEQLPGADEEKDSQEQREGGDDHVQISGDEDLIAQKVGLNPSKI